MPAFFVSGLMLIHLEINGIVHTIQTNANQPRTYDRNVEAVNREGNEAFSDTLEKVENSLIKMQQIMHDLTDISPGGTSL